MEIYSQNNEFSVTENTDTLSSDLNVNDSIISSTEKSDVVTSEMSTTEEIKSLMEEQKQLDSELDQPTIHKYVGGSTDNIIVEVDNVGRIITATLKPIRFKTVADFPVVGSDRLLYIDATENSLYSWDPDISEYRKLVADTGDVDVDLSNYYTKDETYSAKEIDDKISNVEVDLSGYYTKTETDNVATQTLASAKSYTDTKVAELIDSAPETLDTFKEIADAFAENDEVLKALNSAIGNKVNKTGNETIGGVKTFAKRPIIEETISENADDNSAVTAYWVNHTMDKVYQKKLTAGNNIVIEGNTISADLGDGASITKLTSPVTISTLASGVYQLPANCELYLYSGASVNYNNTSPATLNVQTMTESNVEKRLFVLFAEAKGKTQKEVGTNGSFIVGKVGSASGNYHIVGTNNSYVLKNEDDTIYGNKTFDKATKYTSGVSLATTLNDKTLVDANWVNAVLASKGYLTSVPSEYVTETELAGKGYLTGVPSEYVTETELANKGYATQTALNTTNSNVSSLNTSLGSINIEVSNLKTQKLSITDFNSFKSMDLLFNTNTYSTATFNFLKNISSYRYLVFEGWQSPTNEWNTLLIPVSSFQSGVLWNINSNNPDQYKYMIVAYVSDTQFKITGVSYYTLSKVWGIK